MGKIIEAFCLSTLWGLFSLSAGFGSAVLGTQILLWATAL